MEGAKPLEALARFLELNVFTNDVYDVETSLDLLDYAHGSEAPRPRKKRFPLL